MTARKGGHFFVVALSPRADYHAGMDIPPRLAFPLLALGLGAFAFVTWYQAHPATRLRPAPTDPHVISVEGNRVRVAYTGQIQCPLPREDVLCDPRNQPPGTCDATGPLPFCSIRQKGVSRLSLTGSVVDLFLYAGRSVKVTGTIPAESSGAEVVVQVESVIPDEGI